MTNFVTSRAFDFDDGPTKTLYTRRPSSTVISPHTSGSRRTGRSMPLGLGTPGTREVVRRAQPVRAPPDPAHVLDLQPVELSLGASPCVRVRSLVAGGEI